MPSYHVLISPGCRESRHIPAKSWASSPGMGRAIRKGGCRSISGSSWRGTAQPLGSTSLTALGLESEALLCWIRLLCWSFVSVHCPDTALCLISWRLVQQGLELCSCQQDVPRGARPCQGVCISMGLPLLSTSRDVCS